MRARSKKRAKQEREYIKLRDAFMFNHLQCQCCYGRRSTELHHKKGRVGELLTETKHFLAVCHMCHQKIEMAPEWAKEMGFSLSRLEVD